MSLEAILAKIENDAREKAASIIESAENERKEALHLVKADIKEKHHRDVERIRKKLHDTERRMKEHLHREMERALLSHRRHLVDRAIQDAVKQIAQAPDYLKLIEALLAGCDLTGEVEVITAPGDGERITPDFLKSKSTGETTFSLSREKHSDHGGIVMRSGSISLNGTLSMIAELNHDEMVMELSRLLPLEGQVE